ncbi:DivIVA domain-containing protein [Huintestinicola sp.]|uniref:DivIVA domain-containing protein n=1 Tax=Huintestinicola sp. TaxID=2981661 RepID=UPI003D7E39C7
MITAMEINTKRFEQAKPGYKPEEVDEFLNQIADQISKMTKEKEDTEKKIEVLVESIRRYKADEEALKDAMIGAQKQARAVMEEARGKADAIISEAQQKAEQIISAANVKADEIVGSTAVRAQREKETLEKMQTAVTEFKSNLLSMYKSHLELITSLPESDTEEKEETAAEEHIPVHEPVPEDMEATRVIDTASMQ